MTANTFGTLDILMKHSKADHLEQFLPKSLLIKGAHPEDIPLSSLSFNLRWLAAIHPSWIALALKEFPEVVQSEILSIFPETISSEVQPYIGNIQKPKTHCTDFAALYLLDLFSKKIRPPGVTEEIFLPTSPFNTLLYCTMNKKLEFINCLGLFSIIRELDNIVDKITLNKVRESLSPAENTFLTYCRANPIKYLPPITFIHTWNGDRTTLQKFIHREGLQLLAKALINEDASFIWHFLRRLDVSRGYVIESALQKALSEPHIEYFKNHVIQSMRMLTQ